MANELKNKQASMDKTGTKVYPKKEKEEVRLDIIYDPIFGKKIDNREAVHEINGKENG